MRTACRSEWAGFVLAAASVMARFAAREEEKA